MAGFRVLHTRAGDPTGPAPDATSLLSARRQVACYLAFAVLPALGCLALLACIRNPTPAHARPHPAVTVPVPLDGALYRLLATIVVIITAAHLFGALAHWLGQPRVIGEMVAGLLIGPSGLGAVAPSAAAALTPLATVPTLNGLAQLGVTFFMFLVGAELPRLRSTARTALVIGHSATAVPFLAGMATALILVHEPRLSTTSPHVFMLFMGLVLSITAFPVLARILAERGLAATPIGELALSSAALVDITAWPVLALILAGGHGRALTAALATLGMILLFGLLMWFGLRPLLAMLITRAERHDREQGPVMVVLLVVVLLSALVTDRIGAHIIFGAFLAGVVMPRSSRLVARFTLQLEGLTRWLMLPLFFATIGLRTDLAHTDMCWEWMLVLLGVAVAGKALGVLPAALCLGVAPRPATGLAVMMNCRGLTELIVLSIGYDAGLISDALFTALIFMTMVTTVATGALLAVLRPDGTLTRASPHQRPLVLQGHLSVRPAVMP